MASRFSTPHQRSPKWSSSQRIMIVSTLTAAENRTKKSIINLNFDGVNQATKDAMDAILSRRSIRKYIAEQVPEKVLNELLEAAMSVPSAHNVQPWQFVIVDDRAILDEIPKHHPYADMLKDAPLAIVVCGDLQLDNGREFWVQDCAAATENILIAAQAKGLGAVWVGIHPVEKESAAVIRKLLGLPEHIIPLCLIPMGYPAQQKSPANRYDPSKVHHNRW